MKMQRKLIYYPLPNQIQIETVRGQGAIKEIRKVIHALERESQRQRITRARIPSDKEMMAITFDTGNFFSILLKAIKARNVLEIGTSSGYSSLWFAEALMSAHPKSSHLSIMTIESSPTKIRWAKRNFKRAGIEKIVTVLEGDALKVLRQLRRHRNKFDFVFIDADKENIAQYFDLVVPMVRVGGIIAADNMLLPEHFRPWMKKYASHVRRQSSIQTVTVPIGMGEEVSLRLR
jgi:predicted O-methyltransferase YrrM